VQLFAASTQAEKTTDDTAQGLSTGGILLVVVLIALFLWWLRKQRR